jgi:DNA-binding CsgD family transcriptional regulator
MRKMKRTIEGPVIALIGDLAASRLFRDDDRADLQRELEHLIEVLNRQYAQAFLSRFTVTIGDEFQGLLHDAPVIADLAWDLDRIIKQTRIRLGLGRGPVYTPIRDTAVGMDGPAFHAARRAISLAKERSIFGGVYLGFGEDADTILTGLASLLAAIRHDHTAQQSDVVELLRQGLSQAAIAQKLGIRAQTVNRHVKAAKWQLYHTGEAAMRVALDNFCVDSDSSRTRTYSEEFLARSLNTLKERIRT